MRSYEDKLLWWETASINLNFGTPDMSMRPSSHIYCHVSWGLVFEPNPSICLLLGLGRTQKSAGVVVTPHTIFYPQSPQKHSNLDWGILRNLFKLLWRFYWYANVHFWPKNWNTQTDASNRTRAFTSCKVRCRNKRWFPSHKWRTGGSFLRYPKPTKNLDFDRSCPYMTSKK